MTRTRLFGLCAALTSLAWTAGCGGIITDGEGGDDGVGGGDVAVGPGVSQTATGTDTNVGTGTEGGTSVATGTGTGTGTQMPLNCDWPAGAPGLAVGNVFPQSLSWNGYAPGSSSVGTVTADDFFDCDGSKGINAVMFITAQVG